MNILPVLPVAPQGPARAVIGGWRVAPEQRGESGDYSLLFTPFGELVHTDLLPAGPRRLLLVYRVQGEELITDQPSAPREERSALELAGETLFINGIPHLKEPQPSDALARLLAIGNTAISLARLPLPPRAGADAAHIATAAYHGMNFLLTWNCSHIANAALRPRIEKICKEQGYIAPVLCTPEELLGGEDND